ncbi:UNVERIFIED_CONTAM: hypothetical protein Scaly_1311100 [Sesamum calycinum]|uniref:Uncharacterized protein n=1 Tax=Sesamum calycinum TaxID=2727403 RepID=A0AAW2Q6Y2_9LAMI
MGEEESKSSKKRVVDSLGWLTESSIMPRKHRAIEGVGASSILELKAQLYKSQEESKRQPKEPIHSADHHYAQQLEVHRAKKVISAHDAFSARNTGVDARAAKDKLELKAVKDGSASYAALERKAALYDKLVRGELSDEEDEEKYCVDFFRKGLEQDQSQTPQPADASTTQAQGTDVDDDDLLLNNTKAAGLGRTSATVDRGQHKHFVILLAYFVLCNSKAGVFLISCEISAALISCKINSYNIVASFPREVHEEANQAREKVSELKMRRQEQAAARREKLKQAYLRKQLEKLKASKAEQT